MSSFYRFSVDMFKGLWVFLLFVCFGKFKIYEII